MIWGCFAATGSVHQMSLEHRCQTQPRKSRVAAGFCSNHAAAQLTSFIQSTMTSTMSSLKVLTSAVEIKSAVFLHGWNKKPAATQLLSNDPSTSANKHFPNTKTHADQIIFIMLHTHMNK